MEDMKKKSRAEDITGQRFGHLVAIKRAENKNGRTRWECRCDCGNTHTALTRNLKNGNCKSCGCMQHQKQRGMLDLTGRKIGRLTVLSPTEKREKNGSIIWKCQCDCGNSLEVSSSDLLYGNYRSCGCLRKELWKTIPEQLHMVDGTCVEWLAKRKSRSDNTSGFRGVYRTRNDKYKVLIGFKGKRYYVGRFDDFDEAVEERLKVEKTLHDDFVAAYHKWSEMKESDPKWADENPLVYNVERINGEFVVQTNMSE